VLTVLHQLDGPFQNEKLIFSFHYLKQIVSKGRWECEDSNLCGSQHSPEPTNIIKLQELHRASTTMPVCQEIFSQAKPTSARSNLNSFHSLIDQDARSSTQYRPLPTNQLVSMQTLTSQIQTTTSLHILTGLELIVQDHHEGNAGRMLILQAYPSTSFTKCSLALRSIKDIESCSATSLLRSHPSIQGSGTRL